MPITIKISGLDQIQRGLTQDFKPIIARGYKKIAEVIKQAAIAEAPKKTGKLAGGISKTPSGEFGWNIYESHKQGVWVREGTVAHQILPRKARALAWPGLPRPVARVSHPGIRYKNPYPERAVAKSEGEVGTTLEGIGAEIVKKIG